MIAKDCDCIQSVYNTVPGNHVCWLLPFDHSHIAHNKIHCDPILQRLLHAAVERYEVE